MHLHQAHSIDDARLLVRKARAARRRPGTNVDKLLQEKEARLASKIASILRRAGRAVGRKVKAALTKVDQALIQRILDQLDSEGISVEVVEEMTATLRAVYESAHSTAVASVGIEASGAMLQHADEAAIEYASTRAAELVTGISETTREDLRSLIEGAVGEGKTTADVADEIEDSFAFSPARAEMIARTELAYAHVEGNIDGWKASGAVERKQWVASQGCCDECQEMDGMTVDLDDDFKSPDGDIDGPPLHPNCRCDIIPVLAQEENNNE